MILSASRRTDIPNYYMEWFLHRIREGYAYVRNPMNPHQISRISLSPSVVDCVVFWTKNPENMLPHLEALEAYPYYVQFTLTGYGRDIEPNLPDKKNRLIPTFQALSSKIGKERVVWRYDPLFLSQRYTVSYHLAAFAEIARCLRGYTERVVISLIDLYAKTKRNTAGLSLSPPEGDTLLYMAGRMAHIAKENGMMIESCAESCDLLAVGVQHGSCIDPRLIERITGCPLRAAKDRNQRAACGCAESIDIGAYHTCRNGCKYCYANFSPKKVADTVRLYAEYAPLLCGTVGPQDSIAERPVHSLKDIQLRLE